MSKLKFAWDAAKAKSNITKHGVSFEEAKSIFFDENAELISDPDHSSKTEERFVMIGMSQSLRVLVVCH